MMQISALFGPLMSAMISDRIILMDTGPIQNMVICGSLITIGVGHPSITADGL